MDDPIVFNAIIKDNWQSLEAQELVRQMMSATEEGVHQVQQERINEWRNQQLRHSSQDASPSISKP